jgi:ankyrin repeat protein
LVKTVQTKFEGKMEEITLSQYQKIMSPEDFRKLKTLNFGYQNNMISSESFQQETQELFKKYNQQKNFLNSSNPQEKFMQTIQNQMNPLLSQNFPSREIQPLNQMPEPLPSQWFPPITLNIPQTIVPSTPIFNYSPHEPFRKETPKEIFKTQLSIFEKANFNDQIIILKNNFQMVHHFNQLMLEFLKMNEFEKFKKLSTNSNFKSFFDYQWKGFQLMNQENEKIYNQLVQAIKLNKIERLSLEIASISLAYVSSRTFDFMEEKTLIHYAVETANLEILKLLLVSLRQKDSKLFQRMLNKRSNAGFTPLIQCISMKWTQGISELVQFGADVNERELSNHYSAIHCAIDLADESIIEIVFSSQTFSGETKVDPMLGYSLLEFTVATGRISPLRLLMRLRTKYNFLESKKLFYLANKSGSPGLAQTVLKFEIDAVDDFGMSPLHIISMSGSSKSPLKLLQTMVELKKDLNPLTDHHFTPLMFAMNFQEEDFILHLLYYGANLNVKETQEGMNALMILFLYRNPVFLKF